MYIILIHTTYNIFYTRKVTEIAYNTWDSRQWRCRLGNRDMWFIFGINNAQYDIISKKNTIWIDGSIYFRNHSRESVNMEYVNTYKYISQNTEFRS